MITRKLTPEEQKVLRHVYDCADEAIDTMRTFRSDLDRDYDPDFLGLLNEITYHMQSARVLAKDGANF